MGFGEHLKVRYFAYFSPHLRTLPLQKFHRKHQFPSSAASHEILDNRKDLPQTLGLTIRHLIY